LSLTKELSHFASSKVQAKAKFGKLKRLKRDKSAAKLKWGGQYRASLHVYRLFAHGGQCDPRARDSCDECKRWPAVVAIVAARGSQRIESTVMDCRCNEAVESVSDPTSVG